MMATVGLSLALTHPAALGLLLSLLQLLHSGENIAPILCNSQL